MFLSPCTLILYSANWFRGDSMRLKKAFYSHLCKLRLWELEILLRHTLWLFLVFGKGETIESFSLWTDYKSKSKYFKGFSFHGKELPIHKSNKMKFLLLFHLPIQWHSYTTQRLLRYLVLLTPILCHLHFARSETI